MGSGALAALPDMVSEDQAKFFSGDLFNSNVYQSICNSEGNISKGQLETENETYRVFKQYCGQSGDKMLSKTFIKICKDLKWLDKKFTSGDADLTFTKAETKHGAVTYFVFRVDVLQDIANRKGKDVYTLVKRLAAHDGPVLNATTAAENVRFHDDKSSYTGAQALNGNFKNNVDEAGDAEHAAAIKIQNRARAQLAVRTTEELKEIKKVATAENVAAVVQIDSAQSGSPEDEQKLSELFRKFCPDGEMDSKTFIKFCRDSNVISKKFTGGDADLAFQKAKVAASNPSAGSYSSGVVHGKKVNYSVFRAIAIPCIAEKKKMGIDALLAHLAGQSGPTLSGVTVADNVRFHDDAV